MSPLYHPDVGVFIFKKAVLLCRFLQMAVYARRLMSKNAREKIRIGLHISFETQTNKQKYNERNKQHRSCCGK